MPAPHAADARDALRPISQCRLCAGSTLDPLFTARGYRIVRCARCGFAQLGSHPAPEVLSGIYGPGYFKEIKYGLDEAARKEQSDRLAWLARCGLPDGARILDFGCATGDFVLAARERYDVWGLDFSPHAIATARTRIPESASQLVAGPVDALGVPDGYFDAVAMWDVIEHLDDPVATLRDSLRKLRPGGLFFASSPNFGAPIAGAMKSRWAFMTPPEHIGFFSHETLRRLFRSVALSELAWKTRGKSINFGFLIYKAGRVFPELVPQSLVRWLSGSRLGKFVVYVPTGDIQYAAARLELPEGNGVAHASR